MALRTVYPFIIAILLVSPGLAQKKVRYTSELRALFKELDAGYPFFKEKGIEKDWRATKKDLLGRAKKCRREEDFVPLIVDALRALRDGHAAIVEMRPKPPRSEPSFWPGVVLVPAGEGRVAVAAAPPENVRDLPPGTVVDAIDGRPAREFLDAVGEADWQRGGFFSSPQRARFFAYRLALAGERGAKHTLQVRRGKKRQRVRLRSQHEVKGWMHLCVPPGGLVQGAKSVWHTALDEETAYVWFRRMDATAADGLRVAIAAHTAASRWIVDLRGNAGGGYSRSMKDALAKLGRHVAVIIDAGTVSAGETLARDLARICRARIFGTRSAGSSSQKKIWAFPSGVATIRYSVRSRVSVGGKPIEYRGIVPDIELEADPDDLAAGRNTEIEAARAWLAKP